MSKAMKKDKTNPLNIQALKNDILRCNRNEETKKKVPNDKILRDQYQMLLLMAMFFFN